jgi:ornithine carrier protein
MDLKPWESALSGACAGVAYSFLLFPADCVKSTIQTEEELRPRVKLQSGEAASSKSTFTGVFKEIYRSKGIKGLYAGCGVTVARSAPSSALIFLIYDALERYLG